MFLTAHDEDMFYAKLLASGFSSEEAHKVIDNMKAGLPNTPFHEASYEDYNSYAEDNGLGGDTLLLHGTILEYIRTNDGSNYVQGFQLLDEDGNIWMISCSAFLYGTLIGFEYVTNLLVGLFPFLEKGLSKITAKLTGEINDFENEFPLGTTKVKRVVVYCSCILRKGIKPCLTQFPSFREPWGWIWVWKKQEYRSSCVRTLMNPAIKPCSSIKNLQ